MAAVVTTATRPTGTRGHKEANKTIRYFDLTADTGDYAAGGVTITAASLGMKHIDFVATSGGVATTGTAGATGSPIGITYAALGVSFTVWLYETGTSADTPLNQKTAEAFAANFTIRLRVEGY